MAKNLTEVIGNLEKGQRKEFYVVTLYKGKVFFIMNTIFYNSANIFFFLAAQKSRYIYSVSKKKDLLAPTTD